MTSPPPSFPAVSAVLALSGALPPPDCDGRIAHIPALCPFYLLTGLPCPSCGLTRAFVCLGHGQVRDSLHWNPMGLLLYGLCLLWWLEMCWTWRTGRLLFPLTTVSRSKVHWATLAALLLFGVGRMAWLIVSHRRYV